MTKRYFYTEPLAAAWMVKHFGMKFESCQNNGVSADYWPLTIAGHDESQRYYIHPDSLPLLEPQVGDWGRGPYAGEVIGVSESLITIHVPERHNGKSHFCQPRSEFKVTSRNGVAFMWPEGEVA